MSDLEWTFTTIALVILVIGFLISSFKIIPEYERGVVFRLGKLRGLHGSGPVSYTHLTLPTILLV